MGSISSSLLGQGPRGLHVAETGKVALLDHGRIVTAEAIRQHLREQCVLVLRVLRQNFGGEIGALRQLLLELDLHCWIGRELAAIVELVIVGEQVGFQNVQAIELREKISSGVRHVAHRIFRVGPLVSAESGVSAPEVEVVHLLITPVEVSRR